MNEVDARNARRRAKGLPVYLICPDCDGTGYVFERHDDRKCNCGKYSVKENCSAPRCFDGDLICFFCAEEGARPRVENPGADYIVSVLATREVDGEAVCARHATELEEPTVTEMNRGGASHDLGRSSQQASGSAGRIAALLPAGSADLDATEAAVALSREEVA